MIDFPQGEAVPANDPTLKKHVISAKVKVAKASWWQGFRGGRSEFKAVVLIPRDSDATNMFFSAWLPDVVEEHSEVVLQIGRPVYGPCRVAVLRRGKYHDRPHLFVMSKGVEEILENQDGVVLDNLVVMPANKDEFGDGAADSAKDIQKFSWD